MIPQLHPRATWLALIWIFGGIITSIGWAAESGRILRINDDELTAFVSQDPDQPFTPGAIVCATTNKGEEVNCGKVLSTTDAEARVLFAEESERPLVGDSVVARDKASADTDGDALSPKGPGAPSDTPSGTSKDEAGNNTDETIPEEELSEKEETTPLIDNTESENKRIELVRFHRNLIRKYYGNEDLKRRLRRSFGFSLAGSLYGETGGNCLWPQALGQFVFNQNSTIGVELLYSEISGNSVRSTVIGGTVNYHYWAYEPFIGPTARIGIGLGSGDYSAVTANVLTSGKTTPLIGIATVGWRWPIDRHLNVGLEAGLQLYQIGFSSRFGSGSSQISTTSSITFMMPMLLLDFGFAL